MKSVKVTLSVERLENMNQKKGLDFDFVIQREKNIWDLSRKSMLIHSILTDFPIPPVYATKTGRAYTFIDGKQRITNVITFLEDGFVLDKKTSPVGNVHVAGKKFSELPEDMQDKIKQHKFDLYRIDEATMEELEDLFYRLNNGMPLKQIETTRAILGGKLLLYVRKIAETPFFSEKIALSKKARLRFADQELVLQILSLIHNRNVGFGGKEIQEFVKELRNNELQKDLITKIQNVCYYLNEAFPKKEKFLRKLHIPMIFILALENQEKASNISPKAFGKWCATFFENVPEVYYNASQSGSAKKENVQKRISVMREHHDNYFKNNPAHLDTAEEEMSALAEKTSPAKKQPTKSKAKSKRSGTTAKSTKVTGKKGATTEKNGSPSASKQLEELEKEKNTASSVS